MGGHSYTIECSKCGDKDMDAYTDTRDPESSYNICWKCGFEQKMEWVDHQMTKEELIQRRIDCEWREWEYEEYKEEQEKEGKKPMDFEEWTRFDMMTEAI